MSSRIRQFCARVLPLGLIITAACQAAPEAPAEPESPANPLQGVWALTASDPGDGSAVVDPSQPGLFIFAEAHYSGVYAPGADARVPAAISFQPTDEEMVAQHESIIVNTGTYEISGSTVTFRPIIAKSPAFVGGQSTAEFSVDGDVLTLMIRTVVDGDGTSAPAVGGSLTFRRLE